MRARAFQWTDGRSAAEFHDQTADRTGFVCRAAKAHFGLSVSQSSSLLWSFEHFRRSAALHFRSSTSVRRPALEPPANTLP